MYIVQRKTLEVELVLLNSSTYIFIFSFKSSINLKMDDQFFTPAIVFHVLGLYLVRMSQDGSLQQQTFFQFSTTNE